ncbi:hypothetical protein BD769DRAFT_1626939 [Suillus cothurnatus]|nr:hypothetical protein BD769DRAFT_1626939 [Suillus cothurnatus]
MSSPIIFYDIPSTLSVKAWSPNTWKTRYALNIKGVAYKTEWVEYPDIEALAKKIGAPPTSTNADGSPLYTLPMINDPNTGKVVADSFLIAEYLDATYPRWNYLAGVIGGLGSIFLHQLAISCYILNPSSEKYFRATREANYGRKIEEFSPAGAQREADWAKTKEGLVAVDGWLSKNGGGKFVMGDNITYADGILGGWMTWIKITNGENSAAWKDFASWNGGRWGTYITNLQPFATVL